MEHLPRFVSFSEIESTIRERGASTPESQKLIDAWVSQEERKGMLLTDYGESVRHNIGFLMEKAKLHALAGEDQEAWSLLESARYQAYQEGEEQLQRLVEEEMDASK